MILLLILKMRSLNFFKIVTYPPLGVNVTGLSRIRLDFFAQAADMHVHGSHVAGIIVSPNDVQKVFSGIYLAGSSMILSPIATRRRL